jgi:hypothetical protein
VHFFLFLFLIIFLLFLRNEEGEEDEDEHPENCATVFERPVLRDWPPRN